MDFSNQSEIKAIETHFPQITKYHIFGSVSRFSGWAPVSADRAHLPSAYILQMHICFWKRSVNKLHNFLIIAFSHKLPGSPGLGYAARPEARRRSRVTVTVPVPLAEGGQLRLSPQGESAGRLTSKVKA